MQGKADHSVPHQGIQTQVTQQTGHFETKAKAGPAKLMELQNRASTQIPGFLNFLLLLELVPVKSEEGGWPVTVGLLSSGP